MSLQWPAPIYVDGDFAVAIPVSLPQFISPLPNTTLGLVFRQDFMQFLANVAPLALNSPHPSAAPISPDYSAYYLIAEGEKQDMGGGVVKWTRTYSAIPASYDDWESIAYSYIGGGPIGPMSSANVGRLRFTDRVSCRAQNDFFMLGVAKTDPITAATVTPATPGDIPQIYALAYCQQFIFSGTQYGGLFYRQDYLSDVNVAANVGFLCITTPTATQYMAMIAEVAASGWTSGKSLQVFTDTTPTLIDLATTVYHGQLVAENSSLERWQHTGNIWIRKTRYVLAQ